MYLLHQARQRLHHLSLLALARKSCSKFEEIYSSIEQYDT